MLSVAAEIAATCTYKVLRPNLKSRPARSQIQNLGRGGHIGVEAFASGKEPEFVPDSVVHGSC